MAKQSSYDYYELIRIIGDALRKEMKKDKKFHSIEFEPTKGGIKVTVI